MSDDKCVTCQHCNGTGLRSTTEPERETLEAIAYIVNAGMKATSGGVASVMKTGIHAACERLTRVVALGLATRHRASELPCTERDRLQGVTYHYSLTRKGIEAIK